MNPSRLTFFFLATVLVLAAFCYTVEASIITPPLADDPSLVLRLAMENNNTVSSAFTNYNFETGDSTGWTVVTSSSYAPSINWTYTGYEGNYAVKITNTLGGVGTPRYGYIRQNITLDPLDFKIKFYVSYWLDYWSPSVGVRLKDNDTILREWRVYGGGTQKTASWTPVELDIAGLLNSSKTLTLEIFLEDLGSYAGQANHGGWIAVDNILVEQAIVYGSTLTEGRYGYGLNFDGNDYVKIINIDSELFNSSYTVTLWVSKLSTGIRGILEIGTSSTNAIRLFSYGSTVEWDIYTGEIGNLATSAFTDSDMDLIAMVYNDTSKTAKLYVDGTLKVSKNVDMRKAPVSYIKLSAQHSYHWIGIMDELRVYSRALSDSEIKAMYEALRIHIKDETTAQPISSANVTIFNSNTSISVPVDSVTHDAVLFHANMSSYGYSQYFVSVSADNYYERKLITNINDGQLTEMNAYLPPTSSTVVLDVFNLVDYSGSFNNATLQIKKPIGGSLETIFENYFDFNHEAQAYLILSDYYQIYISNNVETRNLGWFQPDPDGQVTIQLTKIDIRNFYSPWISINFDANETTGLITLEYNTTNVTVTKAQYWVNLTNGTNMYYAEMNASAGTFTYSADLNTTYLVRFRVETAEGKVYDPLWYVYWGNVTQKVKFLPSDLPWWASAVIAVGIIIVYLLAFGNFRADASTALAAILVGLFWWLGWLNTSYIVIVIVGIIAVAAIVTYQRKEVRD